MVVIIYISVGMFLGAWTQLDSLSPPYTSYPHVLSSPPTSIPNTQEK
jgi:uncharacterized membrane protein YhhN